MAIRRVIVEKTGVSSGGRRLFADLTENLNVWNLMGCGS